MCVCVCVCVCVFAHIYILMKKSARDLKFSIYFFNYLDRVAKVSDISVLFRKIELVVVF